MSREDAGSYKGHRDDPTRMYASLDLHKVYSQAVLMVTDSVVEREERIENRAENMEKFSEVFLAAPKSYFRAVFLTSTSSLSARKSEAKTRGFDTSSSIRCTKIAVAF